MPESQRETGAGMIWEERKVGPRCQHEAQLSPSMTLPLTSQLTFGLSGPDAASTAPGDRQPPLCSRFAGGAPVPSHLTLYLLLEPEQKGRIEFQFN